MPTNILDKNFRIFLGIALLIVIVFTFYSLRIAEDIEKTSFFTPHAEPISLLRQQSAVVSSVNSDVGLSLILSSPNDQEEAAPTVKKGDSFSVDIILAPGNTAIDGVDTRISYNPLILKVVKVDTASSLFAAFPPSVIDEKEGIVSFSALSAPNASVNKNGKVASLVLKALAPGISPIEFVFTPNNSTDTNAAEYGTGKDALGKVENIDITIL